MDLFRPILTLAACGACAAPEPLDQNRNLVRSPGITTLERPEGASAAELPSGDRSFDRWTTGQGSQDPMASAVALGLVRNAGLLAARERAHAARQAPAQARRLPNPRFTWTEFVEELQTRTGPHVRRLGLSQGFPWPGTLDAAGDVAAAQALAADGHALSEVAATRLEIEAAWIECAQLKTEIELQAQRVELLESLGPVVLARTRAGAGRQDLLRLEVELARAKDSLVHLQQATSPLDARLAQALSLDRLPEPVVALPEPEDLQPASPSDQDQLLTAPQLAPLRARIQSAQAQTRLSSVRRKPKLALGIDWLQVEEAAGAGVPGSGNDPLALRLSVDLPLWREADSAAEREAGHALRAAHLEYEQRSRELRAECSALRFAAEDAQRSRHLHRDLLLPRVEETLRLLTSAYRTGDASLPDLIETERLRLDLQLAYARAGRDQRLAQARLRALLGVDL